MRGRRRQSKRVSSHPAMMAGRDSAGAEDGKKGAGRFRTAGDHQGSGQGSPPLRSRRGLVLGRGLQLQKPQALGWSVLHVCRAQNARAGLSVLPHQHAPVPLVLQAAPVLELLHARFHVLEAGVVKVLLHPPLHCPFLAAPPAEVLLLQLRVVQLARAPLAPVELLCHTLEELLPVGG